MRNFLIVLVVVFASIAGFAQAEYKLRTRSAEEMASGQRRAVAAWCRFDYDGMRLSESSWQKRMRPLTNQKVFADFPSIIVVSRYHIEPQEGISLALNVTYTTDGRYDLAFGYQPSSGSDVVTFRVEDKGGDILITDPGTELPHVSKPVAIRWLKERLETTKSANEKLQIQEALKQLEPEPAVPDAK